MSVYNAKIDKKDFFGAVDNLAEIYSKNGWHDHSFSCDICRDGSHSISIIVDTEYSKEEGTVPEVDLFYESDYKESDWWYRIKKVLRLLFKGKYSDYICLGYPINQVEFVAMCKAVVKQFETL